MRGLLRRSVPAGNGSDAATRLLSIRRIRFAQAIVALALIVGAELLADRAVFSDWWFWVAAVAIVTAAVIEPYYTGPSAAVLYGLGALSAGYSATRTGVEPLWAVYFVVAATVTLAGVYCLLAPDSRTKSVAHWLTTRLGRPLWLGFAALAIEIVRVASSDSLDSASQLAIGAFLALIVCSLDWYKLWVLLPGASPRLATIETAVEPNLLLISTQERLPRGTRVRVTADGVATGVVAANFAHRSGSRVQIVLDQPWDTVAAAGGTECFIEPIAETQEAEAEAEAVAFAAEGTSERTLSLHPLGSIGYGDTLQWTHGDYTYLYQVTGLRLERETWDSSVVVRSRATAVQLGAVCEGSTLEFRPALPEPYAPVRLARDVTAALPEGFSRIGVISGTQVPLGLNPEALRSHHLAILGMSGMGKSSVSRRICGLLQRDSAVVALDGTGEYRTRYSFDTLPDSELGSEPGLWVYEPSGQPAQKAMEFIKASMLTASDEYKVGTPLPRTILLEEAHAFLPEWNFNAARGESEWVSQSCRFILQARKFGLGFILVSQRTAVISKSALSQCESYIIFRTLDGTSLEYVESVVGPDVRDAVSSLRRYQAICVGPAFSTAAPVIVDLDSPDPLPPGEGSP